MRSLFVCLTVGALLVACDGSGSELFGNSGAGGAADGGADPGSGPSVTSGDGGAPSGPAGPGATTSASATTSGDAVVSSSSGEVTSTGPATSTGSGDATSTSTGGDSTSGSTSASSSTSAAASTSQASSTSQVSSSSGVDPDVLACAGELCPLEGDGACCWNDFTGQAECVDGPPQSDGCQTDFGGFESRIECLSPDDCGDGQICCGVRNFYTQNGQDGAWYVSVTCGFECDDVEICEPGVTDCECVASQLLPTGTTVCSN